MHKPNDPLVTTLIWVVIFISTVWIAIIFAGCYESDIQLFRYIEDLTSAIQSPFRINFNEYTLRFVLVFSIFYGIGVSAYYTTAGRKRLGAEHGSAKWGSVRATSKQFSQNKEHDILLTKRVSIGYDSHKHRRNLNVLVIGGSGSGKTRFFAMPNIMQCNSSFVITDPKSEMLKATGHLLKAEGYDIKVLNLIKFNESDGYNPFIYLRDDKDVIKLINNLINNTTPKSSQSNDPFWIKAETALLQALMFYLIHEAPVYEQNFSMILTMLEYAGASEEDENYETVLDLLYKHLEREYPRHIAVKQYKVFKQAAGKTAKSILVSCAVRLAAFNLTQIKGITNHDDMNIANLGKKKTAIFAVIPDNDSSFNYIIGMLYTQIFQELYYQADHVYGGSLPMPVHVLMDEFANVALPEEFDKVLSTMRSRGISASIIIQNLAQLKGLFKSSQNAWETITGNCDSLLYLGGNEQSTHEYISKLLGKGTIDIKTHNRSKGRNGSYTTNFQLAGRELFTADEVRLLDNEYAVLFIRGVKAVLDKKYNLMKHKNILLTMDGGCVTYTHNQPTIQTNSLIDSIDIEQAENYEIIN